MRLCLAIALGFVLSIAAHAELELTVQPPDVPLRPGQQAILTAVLSGVEEDKHYALLPPETAQQPIVSWGSVEAVGVEADTVEGQPRLSLQLQVTAREAGAFSIPSIQARVVEFPNEAALVGEAIDPGTAMVVASAPVDIAVTPDRTNLYIGIAVVAGLAGVVIIAVALRRGGAAKPQDSSLSPLEQARAHVHEARRHRLDGDFYKFYQGLAAAARAAGNEAAAALAARMDERARQVGYGGIRPTEDELDGAVKDIERALAPRQEDR